MNGKHVSTVGMVALCGPTCGGKTTLARTLIDRWESVFAPVVTTTTRLPRPGEIQGIHYRFVSRFEFEQHQARGWTRRERRDRRATCTDCSGMSCGGSPTAGASASR
jgi:hypothetical protein